MDTSLFIIAIVVLVPGMVMALVPALPGMLYMFIIALVYAFIDGFVHVTGTDIAILGGVTAVAMLIDLSSGIIGAKWGGAHWSSLIYGVLGLVMGGLFIPIPFIGSLVGLFIGILGAEWYRTAHIKKAGKAAFGSFAGSLVGMVSNGVFALAFLTLFIIFAWN